jgi:zinc/manganese transport system permease protein
MFSGFMVDAWIVSAMVAVVAGVVGFFVVLRSSAFVAHAIPNGSFAGAAAATLAGVNVLLGLGVFSLASALGIGWLSRSGRRDVATALVLTFMLGLGALLLSVGNTYAPGVESLLFGEILGVSANQLVPTALLSAACVAAVLLLYRPLLLASVLPEAGEARGVSSRRIEVLFLVIVALATTMTVPVVGTLLIFSLMIAPAAAARSLTSRPHVALALSALLAVATAWTAIAASYATAYPIGFFVGGIGAFTYAGGRAWSAWRHRGPA